MKTNFKTRKALKEATNAGSGPQLSDGRYLSVTNFNGIYTVHAEGHGTGKGTVGKVNGGTKMVIEDNGLMMKEALSLITEYWNF